MGAPIILNPEDLVLWKQVYPDTEPDRYHGDGDLFAVGGATLRASIRERLLTLPAETVVRTGHGDNTTIGAEREALAQVAQ